MKKEIIEFYIEYIFAFFRKTNSKKGQGLFFRTIINSAEKSLARTQINNLYFVLSTLIQ